MNPCTSVRAPRMSYTSTHHDRALTCTYAQISLSCRMPTPREAPARRHRLRHPRRRTPRTRPRDPPSPRRRTAPRPRQPHPAHPHASPREHPVTWVESDSRSIKESDTPHKAVYPDETIQAHLAFLSRRRALRPSEEYRVPTDEEWAEFLGHFERRKVSTGTCGRAFGTACSHEHACIRCPMLWPDPTQRDRLVEIRDNLTARIAEAEREGWLGEIEGLQVSLAGAADKLAQIDRHPRADPTVDIGSPTLLPVITRH